LLIKKKVYFCNSNNNLKQNIMNFQLLNTNLEVVKEFKTLNGLLDYTDNLPNMGMGLYYYNKRTKKSFQLV